MSTNLSKSQTNKQEGLIYADLTYKIRGAIFEVFNQLGFGHKEKVYQKAPSLPESLDNQLLHYLKTTNFRLGLLVNFGSSKLMIKRLVWTRQGLDQTESAEIRKEIRENL